MPERVCRVCSVELALCLCMHFENSFIGLSIPVKQIWVCRGGLSMFWGSVQMEEEVTVI